MSVNCSTAWGYTFHWSIVRNTLKWSLKNEDVEKARESLGFNAIKHWRGVTGWYHTCRLLPVLSSMDIDKDETKRGEVRSIAR